MLRNPYAPHERVLWNRFDWLARQDICEIDVDSRRVDRRSTRWLHQRSVRFDDNGNAIFGRRNGHGAKRPPDLPAGRLVRRITGEYGGAGDGYRNNRSGTPRD